MSFFLSASYQEAYDISLVTTADVSFDHFVKVVFASFLHYTVIIFLFVISILYGEALKLYKYTVSHQTYPLDLASIHDSCLKQSLLWWLQKGDFSNSVILSTFISWNST